MAKMLKYLGSSLHSYYSAVVRSPMPWPVIDKLATLEEVCEDKSVGAAGDAVAQPEAAKSPGGHTVKDQRT